MATSHVQEQNLTDEVSLCSICLQQYKSPVSLHCSHSFCRTCLSTHIKSSCENCDTPLGFPCPLCRVFIPAPGEIDQYSVDEWATKFPENKFLTSVAGAQFVLCNPCQEDGEEVKANSWCKDCSEALCNECTKYHKKSRPSRQHIVIPFTEGSEISQNPNTLEICETHDGRKFELFCEKHFFPCCSECIAKEHSNCSSFCQLEEAGKNFIKPEQVKDLQSGIQKFCSKVERIIEKEKANINHIDDMTDTFTKELSEFTTNMIQVVKKLEEEHLNELSRLSKESKSKLQKSVESFEQRLLYLKYWRVILLKNLSSETSGIKKALSYIKLKSIHENLERLKYTKLKIYFKTKLSEDDKKIIELSSLVSLSADEILNRVPLYVKNIDYKKAEVNKISEFTIQGAEIKGGTFVSNGNLFFSDFNGNRCILCDTNGVVLQEVRLEGQPWDVFTDGENEIFVTIPAKQLILKFDPTSFETVSTIPVGCCCFGIAMSENITAIGTYDSVNVFVDGFDTAKRRTLSTDFLNALGVAIDDENNVICGNYSKHNVKKLDLWGNVLFTYNHNELQHPHGLAIDGNGKIFVNGCGNNNIHILSGNGELCHIVPEVENPMCIKFQNATNRFFVSSSSGNVKVFEFNESC